MATTVRTSTLSIGLLNIPVRLMMVKDTGGDVTFDRACKDGFSRIKRQEINEDTGAVVEADDIVRGVREGDVFHPIAAEEIEKIEAATKIDTFEIDHFVPLEDVSRPRGTGSYFLAPAKGGSPRALRLLLEALQPVTKGPAAKRRGARAGVFKLMPRTRQHLAVVYPDGDALYVSTLMWAADWKAEDASLPLANVSVTPAEVDAARALVDAFTMPIEALDTLTDDVREMRQMLMDAAAHGQPVPVTKPSEKPKPSDDLMSQLESSLANAKSKRARATA